MEECCFPLDRYPDAALLIDFDGRILDVNSRTCALYGYSREELIGRVLADVSDGTERVPEYVRRAASGGACQRAEAVHRCGDGRAIRVEVSAATVDYGGRSAALVAQRDVTDRTAIEERVRQASKLEAVGQLAGGVAHDFNNLLTVITGYAEVAADCVPAAAPASDALVEIRAAADRAAALVRQLLAFGRRQMLRPRPVRLGEHVANVRKMLARLLGADVRLVTAAAPDLDPVRADPGQLDQVLMNLAVNARDAMPDGGTLTIECRNVEDGGRFVRLLVSDTGVGMPDEVRARAFEPFFTTKDVGKGTGLGLATVFGIVHQSGGRIDVESRVGVGTTFRIDLPAADRSSTSDALSERPSAPRPQGSETILLVEDEEAVRTMALHTLQASGYAVLDAENGEQALRAVRAFDVPIRLLVTDMVMPGVSGRELADRLTAAQPSARVLYMSGHTDDEVIRGVEAKHSHFLQKPFTPSDLARRVREILDERH